MLHFSTRNNCCEFLASYGVILQSNIQPSCSATYVANFGTLCLKGIIPGADDPMQTQTETIQVQLSEVQQQFIHT